MKKRLFLLGLLIPLSLLPAGAEEKPVPKIEKIGIYDSRSVAISFVGSEVYQKTRGKMLKAKMAEHRKASEAGDQKKVAELEKWGNAQQALLHKQGFSTAPVDDILELIQDQLPAIQKKAGVDLLVSKWDARALEKYQDTKKIEVTSALMEAFRPTAAQKKSALEIQKKEPVPIETLEKEAHGDAGKK